MTTINTLFKIDSFKLRIAIEFIPKEVIETLRLESKVTALVLNTSEILDSNDMKPYIKDGKLNTATLSNDNGITSINVSKEKQRTSKGIDDFLILKVTSKLLKTDYYNGINLQTMPKIVSYLNSVGVKIDMKTMLQSQLTDIDFCRDTIVTPEQYRDIYSHVAKTSKQTNRYGYGFTPFNSATNVGIQWSHRKTATPCNPFLKLYCKELDSKSDSHKDFFAYYKLNTPPNLFRIEYTLKNKKHFKKYKLGNTLADFLNLSQDDMESILKDITNIHIHKEPHEDIKSVITYEDALSKVSEQALIIGTENGIPTHRLIDKLVSTISKKDTKIRTRKKLVEIANILTRETETFKRKSDINDKLSELQLV